MAIEANMLHGVRTGRLADFTKGAQIVAEREYLVPDRTRGAEWLLQQIGKPYDFPGALGLVKPDRDWQREDCWYCYELVAALLVNCGLDIFWDRGHITERELLGINPNLILSVNAALTRRMNEETKVTLSAS